MNKFLAIVAGIILASIALALLGPIILLGIGAAVAYYSVKSFTKSDSILGKIWWGIGGLIGLVIALKVAPALLGVAAVVLLFYGWKQIKQDRFRKKEFAAYQTEFSDFEKDWEDIMKKHK